jgi:DNA-directed RNA polymerase
VLRAVNMIQGTAWQVNTEILEVVLALAKDENFGEIVSSAGKEDTRPPRPEWISPDRKMADMSEREQQAMRSWKTATRIWHEKNKLDAGRYIRFGSAVRMAQRYKHRKAIWFVWFADTRGRLYPAVAGGISPQGSDLQKALLRFADALPLSTPGAVRWFLINGANKWGFDKATLDARAEWVVERDELLISFGEDPLSNRGWMDADKPLQFLAWCIEYARWRRDPEFFVSQLPVGMDGSCNGLQNLSACLRDEVGGKATNLVVNEVMEDIYRRVAEAAMPRLQALRYEEPEKEEVRLIWTKVGVSRSLTKRSVMTTPYGVTRLTAEKYLVSDNLAAGAVPEFNTSQYKLAASVLMDAVWPAIGDVVVKGVQLMSWLKKSSRKIVKESGDPEISWMSPSGFPAHQTYYKTASFQVKTHLHGSYHIRTTEKKDEPDAGRHASGMAPNFVHSLDAAHLHMTVAALAEQGVTSIMAVHDDLGCHAANADVLFKTIREEFVKMYTTHDPVQELCSKYPYLTDPPSKGSLNIEEVLDSDYFFS